MPEKQSVLFICSHNSARSQMAEAYLNDFAGGRFEVESAGLEPSVINPLTVEVMKEEGYDLSGKETSNAFDFYKQGKKFQYVIVVCEKETEEKCPIYPGSILRLHWDFEDPSRASGTHEQQLQVFRTIRDQIKRKVRCFTEVI